MAEFANGYLRSLTVELQSKQNRVRQLIGNKHWGHDGRHKEAMLTDLLKQFVPANIAVGTGFAISSNCESCISREQDILVVDTSIEAPAFHENGLIICHVETVLAAVSVKTTCGDKEIQDSVDTIRTLKEVASASSMNSQKSPWCAGYFFECDQITKKQPKKIQDYIANHIARAPAAPPAAAHRSDPYDAGINLAVCAPDIICAVDYHPDSLDGGLSKFGKIRTLSSDGLATAYFIGQLLTNISRRRSNGRPNFPNLFNEQSLLVVAESTQIARSF